MLEAPENNDKLSPSERGLGNDHKLLQFIYDYYSPMLPGTTLAIPKIEYDHKGPSYRNWSHTIFLPELTDDEQSDVPSLVEEPIHSIVAQIPERKAADQAMLEADQTFSKLPLGRERQKQFVLLLRQQVRHYNAEEFLARYATYQFLSDPICIQAISELFHLTEEQVDGVLRNAVDTGFQYQPNYSAGFSLDWLHAWGYLYASSLFVSENGPSAASLFTSSNEQIESLSDYFLNTIDLDEEKMKQFTTFHSVGVKIRFDRFKSSQNWFLNPDYPEMLRIG